MTTTLAARAQRATPDPRDPMGLPCRSADRPVRHGRVVAWYRGDPSQGAWVLWPDDVLHRPRWEPRDYVVTGTGGR